jgi:hypothetical protein
MRLDFANRIRGEFMEPEMIVWNDAEAVERRLQQLGLSKAKLWEALEVAQGERRLCTPFDPISLPGNIFWGRLTRKLRETYVPNGWKWGRPASIELVVNAKAGFAITACSGTESTGRRGENPKQVPTSKYPKGSAMHKRVRANEPVLPGMEAYAPANAEDETYAGLPTWCLLHYSEPIKDDEGEHTRLWAELSLPIRVGEQGKIVGWKERILLDHKDFPEPWIPDVSEDDPTGPLTEINVPIERLS